MMVAGKTVGSGSLLKRLSLQASKSVHLRLVFKEYWPSNAQTRMNMSSFLSSIQGGAKLLLSSLLSSLFSIS